MHRARVLSLYKRLLRSADDLIFTDRDFYRHRIREEFLKNVKVGSERVSKLIEVQNVTLSIWIFFCFCIRSVLI